MLKSIPLSDRKNLDSVIIKYEYPVGQAYGGYYDYTKKLICIVHHEDVKHEAATLAHEYRHHIQHQLSFYKKRLIISPDMSIPYEEMIKWYFTTNLAEYDALLYEHKVAKYDINDWWLNKLVKS